MAAPGNCPCCGQELPYSSWRAELLDRVPGIIERARANPDQIGLQIAAEWWRDAFAAEFGREPILSLRVIEGGRAA